MSDITEFLAPQDPAVAEAIAHELQRQRDKIELIASENFASRAVMAAQGSCLTNKYAEGYPGKRYYGGCEYVDVVEDLARERAKKLFGAEHANVQPHSGAQANYAAYQAVLKPGDTVLGMNLAHGGHLTHGSSVNFSGKLYHLKNTAFPLTLKPSITMLWKPKPWKSSLNSLWLVPALIHASLILRAFVKSATSAAR